MDCRLRVVHAVDSWVAAQSSHAPTPPARQAGAWISVELNRWSPQPVRWRDPMTSWSERSRSRDYPVIEMVVVEDLLGKASSRLAQGTSRVGPGKT